MLAEIEEIGVLPLNPPLTVRIFPSAPTLDHHRSGEDGRGKERGALNRGLAAQVPKKGNSPVPNGSMQEAIVGLIGEARGVGDHKKNPVKTAKTQLKM
jgi:hypothetical protein